MLSDTVKYKEYFPLQEMGQSHNSPICTPNLFLGIFILVDSWIQPRKSTSVHIPSAEDDSDPLHSRHLLDGVRHSGGDGGSACGLHHHLHPLGEDPASLGHLSVSDGDHPVQEVAEEGEGELTNLETRFSEMSSPL